MKKLHIDFETRSTLDIDAVGAWKYAMHPSTEILCAAVCLEDVPGVEVLTPAELKTAKLNFDGYQVVAHSAHFEYAIYNYILHKRYGWPALWGAERWACTLSRAAMCNLPLSLEKAGVALGIEQRKDMGGRLIMHQLCKPLYYDPLGDPMYNEDPALYQKLYDYCAQDVRAEMELDRRLPELPPFERKIWELDLVINHRGVPADTATAIKAMNLADAITKKLNTRLFELTGGAVEKASRSAAICEWLGKKGIAVPTKKNPAGETIQTIDKQALLSILARPGDLPADVREALDIRREVGKSSTAKFSTILDATSTVDGRFRGALQYHGAGTGRWSGRLVQLQNLPQGTEKDPDTAIAVIQGATVEEFTEAYPKPMATLASCIRGMLRAAEGNIFVSGDYSSIEARVLLWLAGDESALEKYRTGADLYIDMAAKIYEIPADQVTKKQRQLGKVAILGSGYGMGADKFKDTCAAWGVAGVDETLAATAIKAYRDKYTSVTGLWKSVEEAAKNAIRNPEKRFDCCGGRVLWGMDAKKEFLVCRLPSGRHLRYFHPSLKTITKKWGGEGEEIHFMGEDSNTHQWSEQKTYGGKLVENITQAVARDIMAYGMLMCEACGFPIILTVHDELLAEIEDLMDQGLHELALKKFLELMCKLPEWAAGCPITAEGWVGKRYRK